MGWQGSWPCVLGGQAFPGMDNGTARSGKTGSCHALQPGEQAALTAFCRAYPGPLADPRSLPMASFGDRARRGLRSGTRVACTHLSGQLDWRGTFEKTYFSSFQETLIRE
jgi:hypothetical protein